MEIAMIHTNKHILSLPLGKRWSTASGYLRPVLSRPNLKAEVRCLTTRILFDGTRAIGVEYQQNGETKRVRWKFTRRLHSSQQG